VYQISKQLGKLFPLYGNFHTFIKRKEMKKLSQFLKVYISEMPGVIYLKFGMWGTDRWRASPQQKSPSFVQAA